MSRIKNWVGLALTAGALVACSGNAMPAALQGTPDATAQSVAAKTQWVAAPLVDAVTGQSFKVADFKGRVVLVEMMATWCPNCLQQQGQVRMLHQQLGAGKVVSLGLDVDPHENMDLLKGYVAKQGFDWQYAVAPAPVTREIGTLYTAQFLNPSATPMLIVDRNGDVHPLPFGIKSAQTLQDALKPYLK